MIFLTQQSMCSGPSTKLLCQVVRYEDLSIFPTIGRMAQTGEYMMEGASLNGSDSGLCKYWNIPA